jgi:hypothetical protein
VILKRMTSIVLLPFFMRSAYYCALGRPRGSRCYRFGRGSLSGTPVAEVDTLMAEL